MGSEATGWCRLFETLGGVGQSEGGSEYNCCCFWWWCGGFDLNRVGEASVPLGELAWGTGGRESDRYTVFDLGAHCGAVRSERERETFVGREWLKRQALLLSCCMCVVHCGIF